MRGPVVLVLVVLLATAPAPAVQVVLKSGDTYSGEILEETELFVKLKTDAAVLRIERDLIAEMIPSSTKEEIKESVPASIAEARARGKSAAEAEVDRRLWLLTGCLQGPTGVLRAYVTTPEPPVSHLVGKDYEYVAAFSDAYVSRGKCIQSDYAKIGCAGSCLALSGLLLFFWAVLNAYKG